MRLFIKLSAISALALTFAIALFGTWHWWQHTRADKHFRALLEGDPRDRVTSLEIIGTQEEVLGKRFVVQDDESLQFMLKGFAKAKNDSSANDSTSSYKGRIHFASGDYIDVRFWFNLSLDGLEVEYIWYDWLQEEGSYYEMTFPTPPPARPKELLQMLIATEEAERTAVRRANEKLKGEIKSDGSH